MANMELQFEMAMRDQVIYNQREAQRNLWNLIMGLGLNQKQIMELAARQGITIEDWTTPLHFGTSRTKQSLAWAYGTSPPLRFCPDIQQSYSSRSCIFQHCKDFSCRSCFKQWDSAHTVRREEHHSSYYMLTHDHSQSAYLTMGSRSEHWMSGRSGPCLCSPEKTLTHELEAASQHRLF